MTQAKAASLTSALFARKGAASPASLVIAELQADEETESLPGGKRKGRGRDSSERRQARLPEIEQELPLLAFVDAQRANDGQAPETVHTETVHTEAMHAEAAQAGEDGPVGTDGATGAAEDDTEAQGPDGTLTDRVGERNGEASPAASLLDRSPLGLRSEAEGPPEQAPPPSETPEPETLEVEAVETEPGEAVPFSPAPVVGDPLVADPAPTAAVARKGPDLAEGEQAEAGIIDAEIVEPEDRSDRPDVVAQQDADELDDPEQGDPKQGDTEEDGADGDPGLAAAPLAASSEQPASAMPAAGSDPEPRAETETAALDKPATAVADGADQGDGLQDSQSEKAQSEKAQSDEAAAIAKPDAQDPQRTSSAVNLRLAQKIDGPAAARRPKGTAAPTSATPTSAGPSSVIAGPRRDHSVGRDRSPWRMAAVIAVGAALGFGAYTFWPQSTEAPQTAGGPEFSSAPQSSAPAGESTAQDAGQDAAQGSGAVAPTPSPAVAADAGDPAGGDAQAERDAPDNPALPSEAAASPEPAADPSFDIIRIEPNGQSIIAGRAEPLSEWILLNNGEPIGTVQADVNGEWVLLPDSSLVPGANDFSLVRKAERGKVEIPATIGPSSEAVDDVPEAPTGTAESDRGDAGVLAPLGSRVVATEAPDQGPGDAEALAEGAAAAVALPRLKPQELPAAVQRSAVIDLAPGGGYQVQFASVRQSDAAERERERLIGIFPALLGGLGLRVQEATIDGAGVFYRLRTGPIDDLGKARELCRRLEAEGQGCLVVVRAEDPPMTGPDADLLDPPGAIPPPNQQAEIPD
ncbi:SPOR domain-containing protein [Pelagibius sp.]|uniref:SPOR domain-containing protein n=1 Tax=Pelagibius sp. TaxID=1931238 RepID=UPI003B508D0A